MHAMDSAYVIFPVMSFLISLCCSLSCILLVPSPSFPPPIRIPHIPHTPPIPTLPRIYPDMTSTPAYSQAKPKRSKLCDPSSFVFLLSFHSPSLAFALPIPSLLCLLACLLFIFIPYTHLSLTLFIQRCAPP